MHEQGESEFLYHEPCPECGSRDNAGRYSDGHLFCFGCRHYEPGEGETPTRRRTERVSGLLERGEIKEIKSRCFTEETCRRWGYSVVDFPGDQKREPQKARMAEYRDEDGNVVAQKLKFKDGDYKTVGTFKKVALYGEHLWRNGGRKVVVVEGEDDAHALDQAMMKKWPVVSVPNGADGAKKALIRRLEWLLKFEQIVLCFDNDEAGRKARDECVELFPPGRVFTMSLPRKDCNEMTMKGETDQLVRAFWEAKEYRPDGIVTIDDVMDEVLTDPTMGMPWIFPAMNEKTYGRRHGELVFIGAGTGVGKTTWLTQQIGADLLAGHHVSVFMFEQSPAETVKRVAGQIAGKLLHVPDVHSKEERVEAVAMLKAPGVGTLHLYNHFGACDWEVIKSRIRYLAHAHGVRLFYVDHLTALAQGSASEVSAKLEVITAEAGLLVKELNVWICFVSHLSTPDGKSHEEGGRVTLRHFKGSRAIGFWAHFAFGLERDQQADEASDRSKTILRVLKDRFTGQSLGLKVGLTYEPSTGRLIEVEGDPDCPFEPDDTQDF
jgi:twinkle protein